MSAVRKRLGYTGLFALLLALSFPFRAGELAFDVGWLAAWLALAPLALLIRELAPCAAFYWGFLAAWLGYTGAIFWLYVVITVHGGAPPLAGVLATLGASAYFALHGGAACALARWLEPYAGRAAVLVLPAAWVLAEQLRTWDILDGFPWAFLGYAAVGDAVLLALASLIGVWGLSFVYALAGSLVAAGRSRAVLAWVVLAHGAGLAAARWPALESGSEPPLRAALIQANIAQGEKWNRASALAHLEAHARLSRAALARDADLFLWPESAVTGFIEAQPEFAEPLRALAAELGRPLVVGGLGLTWLDGQREPLLRNSAFVIDPARGPVDRYDKSILVPFGEYLPLRWALSGMSAFATGLANLSDIAPGDGPRNLRALRVRGADPAAVGLICYEVVYPDLVRAAVQRGARLLVNVTNDAWYGRSSAPEQFLAIAALRSAEHGLPMLRAANTGVSAVIDARGRVLERTPLFVEAALVREVPAARSAPTLYTRVGDLVVYGCAIGLAGLGGLRFVRRRRG